MRQHLEMTADRIEHTLAAHKVQGSVWGGKVLPRFVRYQVMVPTWQKLRSIAQLDEELALALSVESVRIYRENAVLIIEVPRSDADTIIPLSILDREMAGHLPEFSAVVGIAASGKPLALCITSTSVVHVLIVGTTGSGKTVLQRTLLASMMHHNDPERLRIVLIDGKNGRGLETFEGSPHVVGNVITGVDESVHALRWLVEQMEQRDRERRSTPVVVIAIDELADLAMRDAEIVASLTRIAQRGREAGIHIVATTQRPDSSVMTGLLKSNFPARFVGRVATAHDSVVASGRPKFDAHKLLGRGDFIGLADAHVRFQAACRDEEIDPAVLEQLLNATGRTQRMRMEVRP